MSEPRLTRTPEVRPPAIDERIEAGTPVIVNVKGGGQMHGIVREQLANGDIVVDLTDPVDGEVR